MRLSSTRLVPLSALLSCLLLLSLASSLGSSQLTAYSETRSFRDALEGRSMEEVLSGPVDKDTSSYGGRTSGGSSVTSPSESASGSAASKGGDYGSPSQDSTEDTNSNSGTGQMMINIPANGNLNPVTTQQRAMEPAMDDQQQQKSSNGDSGNELEREAGPISPDFPIDTQQQMMEQQQKMMIMKAKQMLVGRSGRLTGPGVMPASMIADMMRAMREESMRKKMMMMKRMQNGSSARSGRLQQEQQQQAEEPAVGQENKYDADSVGGGQMMMPASNGYGKKMGAQASNGDKYDNSAGRMQEGGQQQQQQQIMVGTGEQEKGYGGSGEQEDMLGKLQQSSNLAEMKRMRAKYAKMMNGNGNGNGDAYKRQPSTMAQSMMMSLANKAAYMARQQEQQMGQSQRQDALSPMMMPQNGAYGSGSVPNSGAEEASGSPMAMVMPLTRSSNYQSIGTMRPMRRANQRKTDKKISPAMMNAMLNKMLGGRQAQSSEQPAQADGYSAGRASGEAPKQMQMAVAAMLMKQPAPMRAEMLSQMMTGAGDDSSSLGYGSNNKRKLYRQIMMSSMQQQQQMNGDSEDEQQQQVGPMGGSGNYGDRSSPAVRPMMAANGSNNEAKSSYGQDSTMSATPSSYSGGGGASTMGPPTLSYGGAMSTQQSTMDSATGYDTPQDMAMGGRSKTNETPDIKGMQQQQQQHQEEQPMMKPYDAGANSPGQMMSSMRMVPKMRYGSSSGYATPSERPANGKLMQQVMQMMRMKQMAANGGQQQQKPAYGVSNDQQQQQMDASGEMGGEKMPVNYKGYQAADGQQEQQTEESDAKASGGAQRMQSAAYGTKSAAAGDESSNVTPGAGVKGASGPGSRAMNRPAMSMGMSYGQEQQQRRQSADEDQYGAAPMGQAEPFAFDFKVEDEATGNNQYRKEESDKNGVVRGSYGYMDTNSGVYRHVEYVADENGFRANIKSNEPGLSDKSTSQQPVQQQMEERGQTTNNGAETGIKSVSSSSDGAYPSQPLSSSSSLGGSAALQQQDAQLPIDEQTQQRQMQLPAMDQKMAQEQQKQMSAYQGKQQQQQQQQQQQATGGELEK